MPMKEAAALDELARLWRRPLDRETRERLAEYGRLLLEWGARINLTGARSIDDLVNRHFPDAFAAAARLGPEERVIDVGSGGGLPAIPLAILRPDCPLVLVEPTAKKVAFLRAAVRTLRLDQVSILPERVSPDPYRPRGKPWSEGPRRTEITPPPNVTFDVAMSRATFPLAEWLLVGSRMARPGGRVFAFASHPARDPPPLALSLAAETPYVLLDRGRRWLLEYVRRA